MRGLVLLFLFTTYLLSSFGQSSAPKKYLDLIKKADSLYASKDYKGSGHTYSLAFRENGWKARPDDRYNAACAWAMANVPDSAFFNLIRIVTIAHFLNYQRITTDPDLFSLHSDVRWEQLIKKVKENKERVENNLNQFLVQRLDSIYKEDQEGRGQMEAIIAEHGSNSKEAKALWPSIKKKDSVNLIKVTSILDAYGWLGPEIIGQEGKTTLFLVIQHSDQKTQEKYLPMMRDAVKSGKANSNNLALLEDRLALEQGKKQVYGSQVARDDKTGKFYVLPLEDPDNVDKRRSEVGLPPLAEYVNYWGIKWDVEQYKKHLAEEQKKRKN